MDIYIPDHRGTGHSKVFACPDHAAPGSDVPEAVEIWSRCLTALRAEWGDGLRELTITNAAYDLGALIWRMRHPGEDANGTRTIRPRPSMATATRCIRTSF